MTRPISWLEASDILRMTMPDRALVSDSRQAVRGDIFFAYSADCVADGRNYIAHAIEQGVAGVVYEAGELAWRAEWDVPHWGVMDLYQWAGPIANQYYGQPDKDWFVVAVTGTNGKTSCTQWLAQALSREKMPTVVVGTLGVGMFLEGSCSEFKKTGYTTPDAVQLQRQLAVAREAGVTALAIEASSIGLQERRLDGMHVDVALLTNVTRDHLDYHGDMASYEAAKAILFDWTGLRHAVVNMDDAFGERVIQRLERDGAVSVIGYTLEQKTSEKLPVLSAKAIRCGVAGTDFQVTSPFGSAHIKTRLVGTFNVSNVLGVMGVLLAKGIAWGRVVALVEALEAVAGRMQPTYGVDGLMLVIDYAHTPDALEKALLTLHQAAQERGGQLWCVFGCGGNRDVGKRPHMGAVSEQADRVILTSDNPRLEHPEKIMSDIFKGMSRKPEWIEDRASAILYAVKHAAKQDVILLAGKGHETVQEIMGRALPFSDSDHAALALASRGIMKGVQG